MIQYLSEPIARSSVPTMLYKRDCRKKTVPPLLRVISVVNTIPATALTTEERNGVESCGYTAPTSANMTEISTCLPPHFLLLFSLV